MEKTNRIHSEKTLMNWKKEDLVAHCIALEYKASVMVERFEVQYQNCMNMIDDMNLLNKTVKEMKRHKI